MTFETLTPVIFVEAIEPCLPFWTERLGFERTMEVPHGERLGCAAVKHDGVQVMYQSYASAEADVPAFTPLVRRQASTLFVRVSDVHDVWARLDGADDVDVIQPMRETFYGSREFFARAPCGTIVGFAEFPGE